MTSKRKRPPTPEELLAAPATIKESERERIKFVRRKAREEAEKSRKRQGKRSGKPTVEDILADLVRVATDPDLNPYAKWRTLSRKRYDEFGNYELAAVLVEFGQFSHALEVAELRDRPGTRNVLAARSNASRIEHAGRYIETVMRPHFVDRAHLDRSLDDEVLMLSISDLHSMWLDPFTFFSFLCALRDQQPEIVLLNGDTMDANSISRHPKIPGWTPPLQLEFDFVREVVRMIREVCPAAEIIITGGNHDLDRWAMYFTQTAPDVSGLDSMRFDKQMGLEEYDVKLAMGGKFLSPKGQEEMRPGCVFYGFYWAYHGTLLGQSPAASELRAIDNYSGQSGHAHHCDMAYSFNRSWMTTPMACKHEAGRSYVPKVKTGWQTGFGYCLLTPEPHAHQYPVVTENDVAHVAGRSYRWKGRPWKHDPMKNWLKGVSL